MDKDGGARFKIDRENEDMWWVDYLPPSGGENPHMYKVTEELKEKSN